MIDCNSYPVSIFIAGDTEIAKQTCRKWCMDIGDCVTVERVEYIYTGGAESGVRIGWINYPKFPREPNEILDRAMGLAELLMIDLCQHSYSITTPEKTYFYSKRKA
jgi:hypothetical protein